MLVAFVVMKIISYTRIKLKYPSDAWPSPAIIQIGYHEIMVQTIRTKEEEELCILHVLEAWQRCFLPCIIRIPWDNGAERLNSFRVKEGTAMYPAAYRGWVATMSNEVISEQSWESSGFQDKLNRSAVIWVGFISHDKQMQLINPWTNTPAMYIHWHTVNQSQESRSIGNTRHSTNSFVGRFASKHNSLIVLLGTI